MKSLNVLCTQTMWQTHKKCNTVAKTIMILLRNKKLYPPSPMMGWGCVTFEDPFISESGLIYLQGVMVVLKTKIPADYQALFILIRHATGEV